MDETQWELFHFIMSFTQPRAALQKCECWNGNAALLTAKERTALTLTPQHHHQDEINCLQMLVRKYKLKFHCCWYSVFRGPSAKLQKVEEKKWGSVERESEAVINKKTCLTAAIMKPSEEHSTRLWLPLDGRKWAHEEGKKQTLILSFTFANMSCSH